MSNKPPSYAELTHRVMRDAPEPLTVDQIIARVHAIRPITTKNPKQTIRNAISASALIVSTGDGRYGRNYKCKDSVDGANLPQLASWEKSRYLGEERVYSIFAMRPARSSRPGAV